MYLQEKIREAHDIALEAHGNDFDKAGEPYFFHVLRVAIEARDQEADRRTKELLYIVGLLHDVIEDTDVKENEILTFGPVIHKAVLAITHTPHEPYVDYLRRVRENELATAVKLADLKDNADFNRFIKLAEIDEKAFARVVDVLIPRYIRAYEFLTRKEDKKT